MLIGRVHLTDKGIAIYDVDGSKVEMIALDALELANWIQKHQHALLEVIRRENATRYRQFPDPQAGGDTNIRST
jgi:hypothetical protein